MFLRWLTSHWRPCRAFRPPRFSAAPRPRWMRTDSSSATSCNTPMANSFLLRPQWKLFLRREHIPQLPRSSISLAHPTAHRQLSAWRRTGNANALGYVAEAGTHGPADHPPADGNAVILLVSCVSAPRTTPRNNSCLVGVFSKSSEYGREFVLLGVHLAVDGAQNIFGVRAGDIGRQGPAERSS